MKNFIDFINEEKNSMEYNVTIHWKEENKDLDTVLVVSASSEEKARSLAKKEAKAHFYPHVVKGLKIGYIQLRKDAKKYTYKM